MVFENVLFDSLVVVLIYSTQIVSLKKLFQCYSTMGSFFSIETHVDRALRIRDLEAEVETLKNENAQLRREITRELKTRSRNRGPRTKSEVSMLKIEAIVDQMLLDPETNLGWVPDAMERPLLRKSLMYMLKAVSHTTDTSSIKFLGHEIVMRMQPTKDQDVIEEEEKEVSAYSEYGDTDYEYNTTSEGDLTTQSFDANEIPL